ncbi:hypothetical protein ABTM68_19290, partial [Acinetobacter baumannii]
SRPTWRPHPVNPTDFFGLKGQLETVLAGFELDFRAESDDTRFHPGRCASIWVDGNRVGIVAQIHPDCAAACDLPEATFAFEIDLDTLAACKP